MLSREIEYDGECLLHYHARAAEEELPVSTKSQTRIEKCYKQNRPMMRLSEPKKYRKEKKITHPTMDRILPQKLFHDIFAEVHYVLQVPKCFL